MATTDPSRERVKLFMYDPLDPRRETLFKSFKRAVRDHGQRNPQKIWEALYALDSLEAPHVMEALAVAAIRDRKDAVLAHLFNRQGDPSYHITVVHEWSKEVRIIINQLQMLPDVKPPARYTQNVMKTPAFMAYTLMGAIAYGFCTDVRFHIMRGIPPIGDTTEQSRELKLPIVAMLAELDQHLLRAFAQYTRDLPWSLGVAKSLQDQTQHLEAAEAAIDKKLRLSRPNPPTNGFLPRSRQAMLRWASSGKDGTAQ